ncbi:MAG: polymer-forming cytoskeletal protein [Pseudolabrys sp.]|nr:polymer-forming cytoskeletal protein [Pseudolabrys sp.]MBV9953924.1 polymer-forming cytoskeletal protein [Pseudolabrys sp.]
MSYFSQSKDRDAKSDEPAPRASAPQTMSTIGAGMVITGNIVSTDAVQINGRVIGDLHVGSLIVSAGAFVEGKIVAQDAVIDGHFKGSIHGNTVKLRGTAKVEGEIFNKSLSIEPNAQFEGVARRLDKAVEAPAKAGADVVPLRAAEQRTAERV